MGKQQKINEEQKVRYVLTDNKKKGTTLNSVKMLVKNTWLQISEKKVGFRRRLKSPNIKSIKVLNISISKDENGKPRLKSHQPRNLMTCTSLHFKKITHFLLIVFNIF